jgi:hypothetical protein
MILSDGCNVSKFNKAVFGESTKKRRPRTSWMAPPSSANIPAAPVAPGFVEPPMAAPEPAPVSSEGASAVTTPPSTLENPEKHAAPAFVERGPSPLEIARVRALEQRERQLEQSIEELAALRRTVLAETEHQLVELAAAIARRVIGRELSLNPEIVLGLAAEGLEALAQGDKVKVRLGAVFDAASIAAFRERVKARATNVEIDHDDKLGPGGCVVETELGRVDESVELRLASVLSHLFGHGSEPPKKGG